MARQEIDTTTNNGTYIGDPAKIAFEKTNANFAELYPLADGAFPNTGGQINGSLVLMPNGTTPIDPASGVAPFYVEVRSPNTDRILLSGYKASAGSWETFDWSIYRQVDSSIQGIIRWPGGSTGPFGGGIVFGSSGVDAWGVTGTRAFSPATDNSYSIGTASLRASVVYAATGTINTSDAREKTQVSLLSVSELAAASELAKEIGSYKFISSVAGKGDSARLHIGMTVQRAIEVMISHGLDPFAYGFICHDSWGDENGAHDMYGFRIDQLLMFIARGMEERIRLIEDKLSAIG